MCIPDRSCNAPAWRAYNSPGEARIMPSLLTQPSEVVDLGVCDQLLPGVNSRTLVQTKRLTVMRLAVAANQSSTAHAAPGDMAMVCIQGRVVVTSGSQTHELAAQQMTFLPAGTMHSVRGLEDSLL